MNNDFSVLAQFLETIDPEVSGHSSATLTPDQLVRIQRFAEGKLSASERDSLLPEIVNNDKAIHELVQALKARSEA